MQTNLRRRLADLGKPATVAVVAALTLGLTATAASAYEAGVDVSRYQHATSLDWASVKKSGVDFAFIKATEGQSYTNPYFADDWAATTRLGIYRGAYHFARPSKGSAAAQAKYFVSKAGLAHNAGDLPPVLDLEVTGGLGVADLTTWTSTFLKTVEGLTGRAPIIYCSPSFWSTYLGNNKTFTHYPLWVAHYTTAKQPWVPGGWPTWTFWQNTSSGRVTGISGNVDKDLFNGSLDGLKRMAQVPVQPTPTPTPTPSPTQTTTAPQPSPTPTKAAPSPTPTKPAPTPTPTAPQPSPTKTAPATPPAARTRTTLTAARSAVYPTQQLAFTSAAVTTAGGTAVAGQRVALARQVLGTTDWIRVAVGVTDARGQVRLTVAVDKAASYRTHLLGTAAYRESFSNHVGVSLLPKVTTRVTIGATAATVRRGAAVRLYGHLTLADGKALAGRQVTLYRRTLGTSRWYRVGSGTSLAPTGWWQVVARPTRAWAFKAVYGGDYRYHADTSGRVRVRVR